MNRQTWPLCVVLVLGVVACKRERVPPPPPQAAVKTGTSVASPANSPGAGDAAFSLVVDCFFDHAYFPFLPTEGTGAGLHQYDTALEDFSEAAVARRVAALRAAQVEVASVAEAPLSPSGRADRALLLSTIAAQLHKLTVVRAWARNPDTFPSQTSKAAFSIMSRNFAPQPERLQTLIVRLDQMPRLLTDGRAQLEAEIKAGRRPPKVYCDVARSQLPGIVRFFEKDVPAAFSEVKDAALLARFAVARTKVTDALRAYGKWMDAPLAPQCSGDFRIGAQAYRERLLNEEMVELPLPRLLAIGYADLRRNQAAFKRIATQVDAKKTPQEVLALVAKDYPPPKTLLQAFRDVLGGLRAFIENKKLATFPSLVPPRLEETPPFARALTFASMDTPGPFETIATEAFFNVTLPEPDWKPSDVDEHMAGFNRGTILSTAIHEAYPGHYLQYLWVQRAKTKVRKLLGCSSNAEGWAHYVEEMIFDEGYGNEPMLRLGQLQDALLRNARYVVGIEMHTGQMTFDAAVDFFVKEGYQTRANAVREVKRGTSDPTYLVYTLGKLMIKKLRDDLRKERGAQFSLGAFHDAFLAEGAPPLKLVRQAMLKAPGDLL